MSEKETDKYAQCVLHRGARTTTSWLPMKFAVAGKAVKLKQDDDSWEDGWVVTEVGAIQNLAYLREKERDHLRQREASDI